MKVFLITYDLREIGKNYIGLYDAIKSLGDWRHPMDSAWFVAVNNDFTMSEQIYDRLRCFINENDALFVVNITGRDCSGWAPKSLWRWLDSMNEV